MAKNYVKENQRILDAWKNEYEKRGKDICFAPDGIMYRGPVIMDNGKWRHEPSGQENDLWANCPIRILYLTKDQNGGKNHDDYWDLRGDAFHHPNSNVGDNVLYNARGRFNGNLVRTLYGLVTATPDKMIEFEDIDVKEAVKISDTYPFARINCKKEVGGKECSDLLLGNAINEYQTFLSQQILNLEADIFVCCGNSSGVNLILNYLNTIGYNFEFVNNNDAYDIYYDSQRNIIAIDSYHLSCRYANSDVYNDIVKTYYNFLKLHPDFIKSHR